MKIIDDSLEFPPCFLVGVAVKQIETMHSIDFSNHFFLVIQTLAYYNMEELPYFLK